MRKYQKKQPEANPNKVQIPDQKTETANAKVIIDDKGKGQRQAMPFPHCTVQQNYLPAPRLMSLIATRTPATPTTTAMAIGATD